MWAAWLGGASSVLAVAGLGLFLAAGFGTERSRADVGLPHAVIEFAHIPNHDQDSFYLALQQGNYLKPVFPTGMFLNRAGN